MTWTLTAHGRLMTSSCGLLHPGVAPHIARDAEAGRDVPLPQASLTCESRFLEHARRRDVLDVDIRPHALDCRHGERGSDDGARRLRREPTPPCRAGERVAEFRAMAVD